MNHWKSFAIILMILVLGVGACANPGSESGSSAPVGINTGNLARDFTLKSLDGGEVSLSDFRGDVVLVNFWATWCAPCRAEIPAVLEVYEALKAIKPTRRNVVTYIACIFMDDDRSILLSVLSHSMKSLERLVDQRISTIDGVMGTDVTRIVQTKKLATTEEWKRTVNHRTLFEFLDSDEYDRMYLEDVIAGA